MTRQRRIEGPVPQCAHFTCLQVCVCARVCVFLMFLSNTRIFMPWNLNIVTTTKTRFHGVRTVLGARGPRDQAGVLLQGGQVCEDGGSQQRSPTPNSQAVDALEKQNAQGQLEFDAQTTSLHTRVAALKDSLREIFRTIEVRRGGGGGGERERGRER